MFWLGDVPEHIGHEFFSWSLLQITATVAL
jgi:hypothetical protein